MSANRSISAEARLLDVRAKAMDGPGVRVVEHRRRRSPSREPAR